MNLRLVSAALSVTAAFAVALPACAGPTIVVRDDSTSAPPPAAPTATATVTRTATPAPPPPPATSQRDAYVTFVRDNAPTGTASGSDLLETGDLICEALDSGATPTQVIETAVTAADGDDDSTRLLSTIIAASVVFLCPEHEDTMMGAVN